VGSHFLISDRDRHGFALTEGFVSENFVNRGGIGRIDAGAVAGFSRVNDQTTIVKNGGGSFNYLRLVGKFEFNNRFVTL